MTKGSETRKRKKQGKEKKREEFCKQSHICLGSAYFAEIENFLLKVS